MAIRYARARELPSRLLGTPDSQARAVDVVIAAYQKWNEHRCPQEILTDFLTDMLHWCDTRHIDFLDTLHVANQHYERERTEHDELVAEVRQELTAKK